MKEQLEKIRRTAEAQIKVFLPGNMPLNIGEISGGDCPIIANTGSDDDPLTLDDISAFDDTLLFGASSSIVGIVLTTDELSTDALCEVADYLKYYEQEIGEYISENWRDYAREVLNGEFSEIQPDIKERFMEEHWQNCASDWENIENFKEYLKTL